MFVGSELPSSHKCDRIRRGRIAKEAVPSRWAECLREPRAVYVECFVDRAALDCGLISLSGVPPDYHSHNKRPCTIRAAGYEQSSLVHVTPQACSSIRNFPHGMRTRTLALLCATEVASRSMAAPRCLGRQQ